MPRIVGGLFIAALAVTVAPLRRTVEQMSVAERALLFTPCAQIALALDRDRLLIDELLDHVEGPTADVLLRENFPHDLLLNCCCHGTKSSSESCF